MKSLFLVSSAWCQSASNTLTVSKEGQGSLSLTYETIIDSVSGLDSGPWLPMIRGKFELTELKRDWTDETNIRICMEIGSEDNYKNQVESIRWYRNGGVGSYWEVQSLIDKTVNYNDPARAIAGQFCKKAISDVAFENLGYSGVETS